MPTILFIQGWRLFFYSNERNEPVHVHVRDYLVSMYEAFQHGELE